LADGKLVGTHNTHNTPEVGSEGNRTLLAGKGTRNLPVDNNLPVDKGSRNRLEMHET